MTNHQDALRMALDAMEEAIHVIENLKRAEYGNGTIVRLRRAHSALSAHPVSQEDVRKEAYQELYAALRNMHWSDGKLAVIEAKDLKLGVQTYSGELLDASIRSLQAQG